MFDTHSGCRLLARQKTAAHTPGPPAIAAKLAATRSGQATKARAPMVAARQTAEITAITDAIRIVYDTIGASDLLVQRAPVRPFAMRMAMMGTTPPAKATIRRRMGLGHDRRGTSQRIKAAIPAIHP